MTSDDGIAPDGAEFDEALGAARVSVKGVRRDHARAAIAAALFGDTSEPVEPIGPAKLDRFVIIDKLGRGGMGVVYSAYDPELDRRVAVKVLQSGRQSHDAEARARLIREAQALARLSHPNVVPVHDVGVIDDQVFIVMEFVSGRDLGAWLGGGDDSEDRVGSERTWPQILDIYRQAGQGLAAAHKAGLVHRDFKPENAIVGADGRVRVLDFGLARGDLTGGDALAQATAEASENRAPGGGEPVSRFTATMQRESARRRESNAENPTGAERSPRGWTRPASSGHDSGAPLLDVSMTATGAVMGTPAYMSPEQFAGLHVGRASDQFSFCVALYEALYGERPYQGSTLAMLGARLVAGEMVDPPRGAQVPGWLLPILRRGLASEPGDRYPSMDELLGALARDPARTRRRWLLAAAALALAVISASVAYAVRGDESISAEAGCAEAGQVIAETWNSERRAAVTGVIVATGHPYAEQAAQLVSAKLDKYAASWADMRTEACESHRQGVQSGALLDKRMRCLDRRRDALVCAVDVLAGAVEAVDKTVLVAENLPGLDYCGDVEALEAEVAPPEDPAIARQVADLRLALARAKAEEDAGGYEEPLARVEGVLQAARAVGYQPLVAEALLSKGRIAMRSRDRRESIEPLSQAALVGFRAGVDRVALEALARRIYSDGTTRKDGKNALAELPLALVLAERVPGNGFVSALLLNNAGVVANASGQRGLARDYFQRAKAIKERLGDDSPLELVNITKNLVMVAEHPAQGAELTRIAQTEFADALGPEHPLTLSAAVSAAGYVRKLHDAHQLREDACERFQRLHGNQLNIITDCLYYSGLSYAELGQEERAVERFSRLAELLAEQLHYKYYARFAHLARGFEHFYRKDYRPAIAAFERTLQLLSELDKQPWWLQIVGAEALRGIGMNSLALRDYKRAIESLRRAIELLEVVTSKSSRVDNERQLALARSTLVSALAQASDARGIVQPAAEAEALVRLAQEWYRGDPRSYAQRLRELDSYGVKLRK